MEDENVEKTVTSEVQTWGHNSENPESLSQRESSQLVVYAEAELFMDQDGPPSSLGSSSSERGVEPGIEELWF